MGNRSEIIAVNPDERWNGQIIYIGSDPFIREKAVEIVRSAGGRIVNPLPTDFDYPEIEQRLNAIAAIVHVPDWNEPNRNALSSVEKFCRQHDLPLLILLPLGHLDSAMVAIEHYNTEYLFTGEDDNLLAELLATLNTKITETMPATFSNRDEPNLADLREISADVDRIAKALSKLSAQQPSGQDRDHIQNPFHRRKHRSIVSDDHFGFKGDDSIASVPLGERSDEHWPSRKIRPDQLRSLIKARRLREQYFNAELFADPAWDMLLDLMAARLENAKVSVSSLCIAASVPPTTALRWIKTMTEENLFERKEDDKDGRRIFIQLSDETATAMTSYFAMVQRINLPMA